jgi:hypothetical protein
MSNAYKTAISRKLPSVPMQYLNKNDLLVGRKLDYGCGRMHDAKAFGMVGYDPYYNPIELSGEFDTITCNYVLNVIDNAAMRCEVLETIHSLLAVGGTAYITVRRDVKRDGYTSKGTYQCNVELELPIVKEVKGAFCIYKMLKLL